MPRSGRGFGVGAPSFGIIWPFLTSSEKMKKNIHPDYRQVKLICSCGNELTVGAAMEQDSLRLDICSKCHPFYTGKQKLVDTSGRVERFRRRFGSRATSSA